MKPIEPTPVVFLTDTTELPQFSHLGFLSEPTEKRPGPVRAVPKHSAAWAELMSIQPFLESPIND